MFSQGIRTQSFERILIIPIPEHENNIQSTLIKKVLAIQFVHSVLQRRSAETLFHKCFLENRTTELGFIQTIFFSGIVPKEHFLGAHLQRRVLKDVFSVNTIARIVDKR